MDDACCVIKCILMAKLVSRKPKVVHKSRQDKTVQGHFLSLFLDLHRNKVNNNKNRHEKFAYIE